MLVARCFSHCVQATERYYELLHEGHAQKRAAELSLVSLVWPGTLGIFTDVCGLLLVALAPIPAMERFALFTGLWAMNLVPCSVFLTPILLSLLPRPKNLEHVLGVHGRSGPVQRGMRATLDGFATLAQGAAARRTALAFVLITAVSVFYMLRIPVGNPVEGTNLLRHNSEFNLAVRQINQNFPGCMTMEVVFEGKDGARIARQSDTLTSMRDLQQCLEASPHPPSATLSFADMAPEANRVFNGGNPKWAPLDGDDAATAAAVTGLMAGTNAKAFGHVADFELRNATVSLWYPNNKQETVDNALAEARKCVAEVGEDHKNFRIRLASGAIALQQTINDTVVFYEGRIVLALNLVILIGCSFAYRSLVAGVLLLIPVNLANAMLTASMSIAGLGLDVNSLPILAIGIGVGIDYGIYLLSRICEEYHAHGQDWGRTITAALTTTGKAIMFTASIMLVGILPWYFLSGLKFMADMGLLLVLIMLINMVLSLVVLPLLVWFIKPRFVGRKDLLVGEGVDLSAYVVPDAALAAVK
jgi:predicted RND superfamily exporter protein